MHAGPLSNSSFETGAPGQRPPAWRLGGKDTERYSARIDSGNCQAGPQCALVESHGAIRPNFSGLLYQDFDARPFRDKTFRFRAALRTSGRARLMAHIWREDASSAFYDNMARRPITDATWRYYEIAGEVAADARTIEVGVLLDGAGAVWLDDVSFEITGGERVEPARALTARGLENLEALARLTGYVRYFHPSDQAASADWNRLTVAAVRSVESAANADELATKLRRVFAPVAPRVQVWSSGAHPALPAIARASRVVMWEHHGLGLPQVLPTPYRSQRVVLREGPEPVRADLPGGVTCVVPVALFHRGREAPKAADLESTSQGSPNDRATRLAAVILAWNVFEHFYPYFDQVRIDWIRELGSMLSEAASDADARAFRGTLQKMTVVLHDGHGILTGPGGEPTSIPPVLWTIAEGRITALSVRGGVDVRAGDAVVTIDGRPAMEVLAAKEAGIPGATPQCIGARALPTLMARRAGEKVRLELEPAGRPGSRRTVVLECTASPGDLRPPRPAKIAEIERGIFYVDLERVSDLEFARALPRLTNARGIVFDVRGYPNYILQFFHFFGHLVKRPVNGPPLEIPVVTRPDRAGVTFAREQWQVAPEAPYLAARKAFLSNGRAISAAETILGMVEYYKLGEIVGEASAGTNGVVNPVRLPGGYELGWTGMRVTKHDGSPLFGVGIQPTIPVSATRAGIAAGRDVVLERAVRAVQ